MKRLIITNGKIILPTSIETDKILICINQKIRQIVASNEFTPQPDDQIIDAAGNYVAPGFIDMHIHGGGGHDFMDGTVEAPPVCIPSEIVFGAVSEIVSETVSAVDSVFSLPIDLSKDKPSTTTGEA